MDLRQAGYEICPVVNCKRSGDAAKGEFDKQNCWPALNQRAKWVSWVNPLMLKLEDTHDNSLAAVRQQRQLGPTFKPFRKRLLESIQTEKARRQELRKQGKISPQKIADFNAAVAMPLAKGLSRIDLAVDHMSGFGPETITFQNPPPGIYNVAVHAFSYEDGGYLRDSNPTVKFWIGDAALIHCKLDISSCPDPNYADIRWWNVASIKIEQLPGTVTVGNTIQNAYQVKILPNGQSNKKVQYRDLPTIENSPISYARSSRRRYWRRAGLTKPTSDGNTKNENVVLQQHSCTSVCEVTQGDASKCLEK